MKHYPDLHPALTYSALLCVQQMTLDHHIVADIADM